MDKEIKNEEAVAEEIKGKLVEAWRKFLDYYKKKAPVYRENWPVKPKDKKQAEKEAKESHWICWDEYDLTFLIGRFFIDILKEEKEGLFSNIEIHFEKNINSANFGGKGYVFEDKLPQLKEKLGGKWPKVDIIVAYEDKNSPLLLCAEVNYFHCSYPSKPDQKIDKDKEKLKAIRDCRIAQRVVLILFDDYYYYKRGQKTTKKIKDKLNEIKKAEDEIEKAEKRIEVLNSTSEEKLPQPLREQLRSQALDQPAADK